MRNNGPVTGHEYLLPQGQSLMSTTDLKGRITHCNAAFAEASGYSRDELLGQSHNIIRHPDMPQAAFADLWATVQRGQVWSMPVKNRRKNGDHYWVSANITPLLENSRIVGYMSVRTPAPRSEVRRAEALFAKMRAAERRGAKGPVVIRAGQVWDTGLAGLWAHTRSVLHKAGIGIPALLASVCAAAVGTQWGFAAGALVSIPLGGLATLTIQRHLDTPLVGILRFVRGIAAGDLTAKLDTTGTKTVQQLKSVLNQLSVNLHGMVGDARGEVQAMESVVATVAEGKESLAASTDSQAAGLQQSSAALKQLTEAVRQNVNAAEQGAALAEQTLTVAMRSTSSVDLMRSTMRDISDSAAKISDITQVIDSISFQTNILALNAAVEAARAGEQGRGFAVVANEVRALANRTTQAAREIKQLSQKSHDRVSAGVAEVTGAATAITDTASAAHRLSEIVDNVHRSSREQLQAISEISAAVEMLDDMTQGNTLLVQRLSASADTLSTRARALASSVKLFRTQA